MEMDTLPRSCPESKLEKVRKYHKTTSTWSFKKYYSEGSRKKDILFGRIMLEE